MQKRGKYCCLLLLLSVRKRKRGKETENLKEDAISPSCSLIKEKGLTKISGKGREASRTASLHPG